MSTVRPPTPYEPPVDGCEWAAVPDPGWQIYTGGYSSPGSHCRQRAGGDNRHPLFCRKPAVARLRRGSERYNTARWWAYCAEHMYGRWIEDGQVMHWVLREKAAS